MLVFETETRVSSHFLFPLRSLACFKYSFNLSLSPSSSFPPEDFFLPPPLPPDLRSDPPVLLFPPSDVDFFRSLPAGLPPRLLSLEDVALSVCFKYLFLRSSLSSSARPPLRDARAEEDPFRPSPGFLTTFFFPDPKAGRFFLLPRSESLDELELELESLDESESDEELSESDELESLSDESLSEEDELESELSSSVTFSFLIFIPPGNRFLVEDDFFFATPESFRRAS